MAVSHVCVNIISSFIRVTWQSSTVRYQGFHKFRTLTFRTQAFRNLGVSIVKVKVPYTMLGV